MQYFMTVVGFVMLSVGCWQVGAEDIQAKTLDGRSVVLRSDNTWEFVEEMDRDPDNQYQEGIEAMQRGDFRIAYDLLHPLAEQGDPGAQISLGALYLKEGWVGKDKSQATRWFRKAADQGDARGMYNLGIMLERSGDDFGAERWYRKAVDKGVSEAARRLGVIYEKAGMLGNAGKWYKRAREMEGQD